MNCHKLFADCRLTCKIQIIKWPDISSWGQDFFRHLPRLGARFAVTPCATASVALTTGRAHNDTTANIALDDFSTMQTFKTYLSSEFNLFPYILLLPLFPSGSLSPLEFRFAV